MTQTIRCDKCGKEQKTISVWDKPPSHWAAIEGVIYCQECYEKEREKFLQEE